MKRLITMLLLSTFTLATMTACNTMAGVGEDMEQAGESVQDQAEDCQEGEC